MSDLYLEVHQTRDREPTPYELKLAGAIEEVFATGVHDLPGLVAGLRARGVTAPGGEPLTEDTFRAEMSRLGA
ncbi:recombinase-like helix-turn-helix domain-containing protein [Actinomadura sediminis]|uniref:Recombinase-like helix-turn-helix domain-containing protein n=1 Tax=Actinomadura sediminis TaxID=1038904 RepID=A0ABW3ELN4_9ACTN